MFIFNRLKALRLFFNYNFTDFNHIFNSKFESELILNYSNLVEKNESKMISKEFLMNIKSEVIKTYKNIFISLSSGNLIEEDSLFEIHSELYNWIYSDIYDCFVKYNIHYFTFNNDNNPHITINNLSENYEIENIYGKDIILLHEIVEYISKMIIRYGWEINDIFNYLSTIINLSNEDLIKLSKEINNTIINYSQMYKDIEKEIIELSIYYLQRDYIQNQLIRLSEDDNKTKEKEILKKKLMNINFNIENLIKKFLAIYYKDLNNLVNFFNLSINENDDFNKLMNLLKDNDKKKKKRKNTDKKKEKENNKDKKIKLSELSKNNDIEKKKEKEKKNKK